METAEEKLAFLANHRDERDRRLTRCSRTRQHNWVNLTSNDFDDADSAGEQGDQGSEDGGQRAGDLQAVFAGRDQPTATNGFMTMSVDALARRSVLLDAYEPTDESAERIGETGASLIHRIKWTRKSEERCLRSGRSQVIRASADRACDSIDRSVSVNLTLTRSLNDDRIELRQLFPIRRTDNGAIVLHRPWLAEAVHGCWRRIGVADLPFRRRLPADCLLVRFDVRRRASRSTTSPTGRSSSSPVTTRAQSPHPSPLPAGEGQDAGKAARKITKEAIFHYCYAVLHDPLYREKYAQNLKREFPRIPFYADFWQWADWGEQLMALHIGYETVEPFALARTDTPDAKARAAGQPPKAHAASPTRRPAASRSTRETTLRGVPPRSLDLQAGQPQRARLGARPVQGEASPRTRPSARSSTPTASPTTRKRSIDLLARVTTVSVETVRIVEAMKTAAR